MDIDVKELPNSLAVRLAPVIREAERAGCSLLRVKYNPDKGFVALLEWHGGSWELAAGDFRYLVGHMEQAVNALTP